MCSVTKKNLAKITHPGLNKVLGDKTVEKLADPGNLFPKDTPLTSDAEDKPLQYLSNVWLDGTGSSQGIGRNALRMDLGSSQQPLVRLPVVPAATAAAVQTPTKMLSPSLGLGTAGASRRLNNNLAPF